MQRSFDLWCECRKYTEKAHTAYQQFQKSGNSKWATACARWSRRLVKRWGDSELIAKCKNDVLSEKST